jgi:hypothetical protein
MRPWRDEMRDECLRGSFWRGVLIATALLAGCGKSGSTKLADAGKQLQDVVDQAQQTAAQATGASQGSVELTLDKPLKLEQCFASFTPKGASRPAVLQLRTYEDIQSEKFPSVFLWATGNAASPEELAGQTLEGHLFVQRDLNSDVWATPTQRPIAITVSHVDLLSVTCEVKEVEMIRADAPATVAASGKLIALWKSHLSEPAAGAK